MNNLAMHRRMLGDSLVTSCLQTRRHLQRYLDGEADPALAERITRHLDACRACGLQAHIYQQIKTALCRHATEPPAEALERLTAFAEALPRQRT